MLRCLLLASLLPLAVWAQDGCGEEATASIKVESHHAWRPPFGLDRVGGVAASAEIVSNQRPLREYYLAGYRNGAEVERHLLNIMRGKSPFIGTAEFTSSPDELVLSAKCRFEGSPQELARQKVKLPAFEAEAVARPDWLINPIDLGTILVPYDWLLLAGGQTAIVDVAALSRAGDFPNARLRAWFESGGKPVEMEFALAPGRKVMQQLHLPLTSTGEHDVLHIAVMDSGRELWKKQIRTMVVARPLQWPAFGAVETKLRYDAPISVKDVDTGALSSMDYPKGWDPKFNDVVVFMPNGSRFIFWRGSSYIPFWAGAHNTGFSYEWAETTPPPGGFVDSVEPLMDKELRYGRVRIIESTASRVHVRWTYQSTDFLYKVWGDEATEDYYFYPDGFGTRVLSLTSAVGANYELSEFIILTPQSAFPLDVLPKTMAELLFLDGEKKTIDFPFREKEYTGDFASNKIPNPRQIPVVFRVRIEKSDPATPIYFNPRDTTMPIAYNPFYDRGELVTPAYWGSHWPLGRGKSTGYSIDDRIYSNPGHNSLLTWGMSNRPKPIDVRETPMLDTLGQSKDMTVQRWAWLIANTDAPDGRLLDWARSFSNPPSLEVEGARFDYPSWIQERRAIRLIAESKSINLTVKPVAPWVNPVLELDSASKELVGVTLDDKPLPKSDYAWDGKTLWIQAVIRDHPARIGLRF